MGGSEVLGAITWIPAKRTFGSRRARKSGGRGSRAVSCL